MWCATRYRQVNRRTSDTGGDWRRSLGHRNVRVQRCEGGCRRVQAPGKRWECKGAGARQGDTRKNKTRQRQAPSGPVCSEPCVWTHTLSTLMLLTSRSTDPLVNTLQSFRRVTLEGLPSSTPPLKGCLSEGLKGGEGRGHEGEALKGGREGLKGNEGDEDVVLKQGRTVFDVSYTFMQYS